MKKLEQVIIMDRLNGTNLGIVGHINADVKGRFDEYEEGEEDKTKRFWGHLLLEFSTEDEANKCLLNLGELFIHIKGFAYSLDKSDNKSIWVDLIDSNIQVTIQSNYINGKNGRERKIIGPQG